MAAGVAWMSRATQAPIVGFSVLPLGPRRWRVSVDAPIPPPPPDDEAGEHAVLQTIADRWSETIAQHPEHWAANFDINWR